MLVTSVAVSLKYGDGLGGPGNVVGFIGHALSSGSGIRSQSHLCTLDKIRSAIGLSPDAPERRRASRSSRSRRPTPNRDEYA